MHTLIRSLAGILAILLLSFVAPLQDWPAFENNNCKILFPDTPKHDSSETATKVGKLTLYTHMLEVAENKQDSNLLYGLVETKYPSDYLKNPDSSMLKGFFDGAVSGAVKQVNGKLLSEKAIMQGNFPGKEVKVDYGNGMAIITMRIYLAGTRMFAIQTIALTGKETNAAAGKFFGSFKIK